MIWCFPKFGDGWMAQIFLHLLSLCKLMANSLGAPFPGSGYFPSIQHSHKGRLDVGSRVVGMGASQCPMELGSPGNSSPSMGPIGTLSACCVKANASVGARHDRQWLGTACRGNKSKKIRKYVDIRKNYGKILVP